MNNFPFVQKFRGMPGPQRTFIAVLALLVLFFSGWFSVVSIGFGTWLLWNWWQKRSNNNPPQTSTPQFPQQPSGTPPPFPAQNPPIPPTPGQQNQPGQNRPSIDWRNQP